jgi:hypothetical protein
VNEGLIYVAPYEFECQAAMCAFAVVTPDNNVLLGYGAHRGIRKYDERRGTADVYTRKGLLLETPNTKHPPLLRLIRKLGIVGACVSIAMGMGCDYGNIEGWGYEGVLQLLLCNKAKK